MGRRTRTAASVATAIRVEAVHPSIFVVVSSIATVLLLEGNYGEDGECERSLKCGDGERALKMKHANLRQRGMPSQTQTKYTESTHMAHGHGQRRA